MNRISEKRARDIIEREIPERKALAERCGGTFVIDGYRSCHYKHGKRLDVWIVPFGHCVGGHCEICGKPPDWRGLHPHEYPFRSHGGKLSLEQSKMCCGTCHQRAHGIKSESGTSNTKLIAGSPQAWAVYGKEAQE